MPAQSDLLAFTAEVHHAMGQPNPTAQTSKPPSFRQLPIGCKALFVGLAFGFCAGFLFAIGITMLVNGNNTPTQPPIGNGAATSNVTPTPTPSSFTPIPDPTPAPTSPPTVVIVTATPTPSNSVQIFKADDPRFYILVFVAFLILSGIILFRKK
jgi:hypothetical protein